METFKVSLVIKVNSTTCCSIAKHSAEPPFHATNCMCTFFFSSKTILHQQHSCCIISEECSKGLLHQFGFCQCSAAHPVAIKSGNIQEATWSSFSMNSLLTRFCHLHISTSTSPRHRHHHHHYHPPLTHTHIKNTSHHSQMFHFRTNNSYFAVRGWEKKNFFCVQWQLKWRAGPACCIIPSANTKGPIFSWNRIAVYITIVEGMWVECRV